MIPIPDHPIGERFCRRCGLFLPLKDFFKGKRRRFQCKVHSRGRPRKAPSKKQKLPSSEKTSKTSPQKKNNAVAQVWHAAYTDCRSSFGQATVGLSQGELRELFEATGVAEPSTAFRLVPIDPCRALATGNARMAALDERGPDEGAVVEGPGLAMSVDEAVNGQQHDDGEAEKEELDDDDDDDDGEDDDDYNDDEAKTGTATEAATEAVAMDMTTTATGTGTAHGDVGV